MIVLRIKTKLPVQSQPKGKSNVKAFSVTLRYTIQPNPDINKALSCKFVFPKDELIK